MERRLLRAAVLLFMALQVARGASAGGVEGVRPQLRFREDGTFTIAQFGDLHYGEGEELDALSDQVQATVLETEQPDLAVFSGDQVTGYAYWFTLDKPNWTERLWRQLTGPANDAGVPYAVALGNHDTQADLTPREVLALDIRLSNLSLTQQGPEGLTGASNYHIDILDAAGQEVAARLWVLDSMVRGCENETRSWGCVGADTLAWVTEEAALLPQVPSLAFIHIPIPQVMRLWQDYMTNGTKGELSSCPSVDSGAYETLRKAGIQAVYSGHDHLNDYFGTLDGVRLAYGRKTGYGGYGPAEGTAHGARIIMLRQGEDMALSETWIRTEEGERLDQPASPASAKAAMNQTVCNESYDSTTL